MHTHCVYTPWWGTEDTADCLFLNAKYLSIVTSHMRTHCVYTPWCSFMCDMKKKRSLLAQTSLASQPLPPCFLSAYNGKWPPHLVQRWQRSQKSRFLSMGLHASYSHLGDVRAKRKHRYHCTWKVSCLPQSQRSCDRRIHRLYWNEHESENLFGGGWLDIGYDGAVGEAEVDQSAWRMACNQGFLRSLTDQSVN